MMIMRGAPDMHMFAAFYNSHNLHIGIAEVSSRHDGAFWSYGSRLSHCLENLSTTGRGDHHIEGS